MKEKMFFESLSRNIEDELEEINLSEYVVYLGSILPGEKIIGEMNDFEKKVTLWNFVILDKQREAFRATRKKEFNRDSDAMVQYTKELNLINEKLNYVNSLLRKSIKERFDINVPVAFKGNFQIVEVNMGKVETERDDEKMLTYLCIQYSLDSLNPDLKPD